MIATSTAAQTSAASSPSRRIAAQGECSPRSGLVILRKLFQRRPSGERPPQGKPAQQTVRHRMDSEQCRCFGRVGGGHLRKAHQTSSSGSQPRLPSRAERAITATCPVILALVATGFRRHFASILSDREEYVDISINM
jgi:hypothetical protein